MQPSTSGRRDTRVLVMSAPRLAREAATELVKIVRLARDLTKGNGMFNVSSVIKAS